MADVVMLPTSNNNRRQQHYCSEGVAARGWHTSIARVLLVVLLLLACGKTTA